MRVTTKRFIKELCRLPDEQEATLRHAFTDMMAIITPLLVTLKRAHDVTGDETAPTHADDVVDAALPAMVKAAMSRRLRNAPLMIIHALAAHAAAFAYRHQYRYILPVRTPTTRRPAGRRDTRAARFRAR